MNEEDFRERALGLFACWDTIDVVGSRELGLIIVIEFLGGSVVGLLSG